MILRTLRKTTSKENLDQVADLSLQGEGGYRCQDYNSGAEMDKEAAPYKNTRDRSLMLKPA